MRLFQKRKENALPFLFDLKLFTYEHYKLLWSQYFHLHWFLRSARVVILGCLWIDLWGNWSWRRGIVLNCDTDLSKRNTGFPASWRLFPWKTGRLNTFSDELWTLHKPSQFVCYELRACMLFKISHKYILPVRRVIKIGKQDTCFSVDHWADKTLEDSLATASALHLGKHSWKRFSEIWHSKTIY